MDAIQKRFNKVEGQIKAIQRMYSTGRSCSDVVQQVQAARAALGKIASLVLTKEARKCAEEGKVEEFEKVIEKTFKTI